jgi:hypothetical protein
MDPNLKEMIESIAREIVLTWNSEKPVPPKVLFIFCDSTAHESFGDQLIQLENHKISYDKLFLDGDTSSWLGMNRVESSGSGKVIAIDEHAPAPLELPKDYDAIIIPEIDLDNAGRIASGLKGTVKAEVVFSALVLHVPVIIGEDISGLKRSDRRTLKTLSLPPAYHKLFQRYLNELRELGVYTQPQKKMADFTIQKLLKAKLVQQKPLQDILPAAILERKSTFTGKLLTADWVKRQSFAENILHVPQDVILSPLALDVLKEKGVSIQYTGKG